MIHSCLPLRTAVRSLQYEEGGKINEYYNPPGEILIEVYSKCC